MIETESRKFTPYIALLCIPILYVILVAYVSTLQGKYYQAYFSDPSYAYLMNSLNIVNGELPGHTDHPGTTIQLLGGLVIKVNVLIGNIKEEITNITIEVLQSPEAYIKKISNLLVSIIAIAVFLFGFQVYRETKNIGLATISQAFPLTFSTLLLHMPRLQPEPLLIASSFLLATTMVPLATGTVGNTSQKFRAVLTGAIIGIGVVTKVTFVPLILFLLIFQGRKVKLFGVVAFVSTVIILTIPIWDSIPRVWSWLIGLLMHSGRYGNGEIGLPPISFLISSAINLFRDTPLIFCFTPLLMISLFFSRKNDKNSGVVFLQIISVLVLICSFVITIKHPSPRYLMPVLGLSGFFVLIIVLSCSLKNVNLIVALTSIICALSIFKAIGQTKEDLLRLREKHNDLSRLQELAQQYGCITVNYYRSSSPAYALQFGNDFARHIYHRELNDLYPEHVSYNIWNKKFTGFQSTFSHPEVHSILENSELVCLIGSVQLPYNGAPAVVPIGQEGEYTLYQLLEFNGNSLVDKSKKVEKWEEK